MPRSEFSGHSQCACCAGEARTTSKEVDGTGREELQSGKFEEETEGELVVLPIVS